MGVFSISWRFFCVLIVLFIIMTGIAFAQTGTTSLRGNVTDASGAAIVGVSVTISNPQTGVERVTLTGAAGEYAFPALTPGSYTLTAQKTGFQKYQQMNVQLLVNLPATQNITLQVGAPTETVEVSAEAETLNTTDASVGNAFGETR